MDFVICWPSFYFDGCYAKFYQPYSAEIHVNVFGRVADLFRTTYKLCECGVAGMPGLQCTGSGYTSSVTGNRKTKRAGASFESPGTLAVGGRVWPRAAAATPGPEVATLVMEMMGLEIRIQNTRGHISQPAQGLVIAFCPMANTKFKDKMLLVLNQLSNRYTAATEARLVFTLGNYDLKTIWFWIV